MKLPAIVRTLATGALAALVAVETYEPHAMWIPIAVATLGTIGIHVIPAVVNTPKATAEVKS